jgi:hypothetical protein
MSGITLVFGGNLEADAPQGPDDASEPGEENLSKKWPLEESMYVRVFNGTRFQPTGSHCRMARRELPLVSDSFIDAITTVLESESFLLCEPEILYLKQLQTMPSEQCSPHKDTLSA